VAVELEGHGREEVGGGVDVTRTVGWFTSIYPVELEMARESGIGERLKAVKEALRGVPRHGLGYGLLRYLSRELPERAAAEVSFNYLGQFEYFGEGPKETATPDEWSAAPESSGMDQSPQCERTHLLEISGNVAGGQLKMVWSYSRAVHRRETIAAVAHRFMQSLQELIAHCQSPEAGGYTPSDFPLATINQEQLDKLFATVESKS
jgi:microcystin synthetase protein McyA